MGMRQKSIFATQTCIWRDAGTPWCVSVCFSIDFACKAECTSKLKLCWNPFWIKNSILHSSYGLDLVMFSRSSGICSKISQIGRISLHQGPFWVDCPDFITSDFRFWRWKVKSLFPLAFQLTSSRFWVKLNSSLRVFFSSNFIQFDKVFLQLNCKANVQH